ncbi:MAG: response regulator transcription factor, partial [Gemmiger qucibialis]
DNTGCLIEHFGNADAVPQPPERCLSRQAGIMRYCLKINNDWGHWMNRILIVEDEITISRLIAVSLRRAGYDCTVANDGSTAADLIAEHDFDLALLDIMLPGLDGYELLGYLRPLGVPVIFITAKGATKDRVRGLQLGADDYIVKPFEIEELLARVEAVLRRTGRGGQTLTAFDVTMDIVARTVTRQGKAVELTPREFDLLEQLMRNRGAALYRDVLYGRVWGGDLLDSRTLDLHIQRLRKKLGWADKIETVYRVGYRLKSDQK